MQTTKQASKLSTSHVMTEVSRNLGTMTAAFSSAFSTQSKISTEEKHYNDKGKLARTGEASW